MNYGICLDYDDIALFYSGDGRFSLQLRDALRFSTNRESVFLARKLGVRCLSVDLMSDIHPVPGMRSRYRLRKDRNQAVEVKFRNEYGRV